MEIADLGEFGLIKHLTKDIKPKNTSTLYGIGDDCAVMHYPDKEVLVTFPRMPIWQILARMVREISNFTIFTTFFQPYI